MTVQLQQQLANLDHSLALERVGGDERLLREIAVLFLDECPRVMREIRAAVEAGDAVALELAAHSLKGSVGNFGADKVFQAALRLEAIGRSRDLSSAHEALSDLVSAMDSLRPALVALGSQ
ncbi:MAG: Hpt domain-containing protein [Acidobacteria bacterium]|nr:Hpt domain-containing protein [Acidobacteriota bacterium]